MRSFGDKAAPQKVGPDYKGKRIFLYIIYILALLAIGAVTVTFIDPLYIIGTVIGAGAVFAILKYPFLGFLFYLGIYYLRPGERIMALGALRLELVFGAFLLALMLIADGIRGRGIRFPRDRISLTLLILIGVMATSMVFSEWVTQSYDAVVKVIKIFILYYFIVVLVTDERRFNITFWLVVLLTAFIGVEATVNYYAGNYVLDQGIMRAEGQTLYGRNFNGLAMYMATTIPLLFFLIKRHRRLVIWLICLTLIGSCILTLMITGSRSGLLCLVTVIIVFIWFSRRRLLYYILMLLMALAIWAVLPDQYRTRYSSMTEGEIDESTQGRINAWMAGLEMFLEKPIFGVGPAVFAAAYYDRKGVWLSSHSLYVEAIATLGIFGVLSWGLFLYVFIIQLRRMSRWPLPRGPSRIENRTYIAAVYSIIAGLLIAGIFGHILFRDTWYIMAGLTVVRLELLKKDMEKEGEPAVEERMVS